MLRYRQIIGVAKCFPKVWLLFRKALPFKGTIMEKILTAKQESDLPVVNTRYGYIDRSGQLVIDFQFYRANKFSAGVAVVGVGEEKTRFGLIDKTGKFVVNPIFEAAGQFSDGLAPVQKDDKWGYIDKHGTMVIPCCFESAGRFSEGLAPVQKDDKRGYIDKRGTMVIPCCFESVSCFHDGVAFVQTRRDDPAVMAALASVKVSVAPPSAASSDDDGERTVPQEHKDETASAKPIAIEVNPSLERDVIQPDLANNATPAPSSKNPEEAKIRWRLQRQTGPTAAPAVASQPPARPSVSDDGPRKKAPDTDATDWLSSKTGQGGLRRGMGSRKDRSPKAGPRQETIAEDEGNRQRCCCPVCPSPLIQGHCNSGYGWPNRLSGH